MKPEFFQTPAAFRKWLEKNYKSQAELLVGYYKVGTNKLSMTWSQSVDQALCFGWIDGVRRSIDDESYCIRFTPRRPNSIWSSINIKKVEELIKLGLMKPEGLNAYALRTKNKSNIYSYENAPVRLASNFEKQFKENKIAWEYFNKQAPSYKKLIIHWISNAKQLKTQVARLEKIIHVSAQHKKLE